MCVVLYTVIDSFSPLVTLGVNVGQLEFEFKFELPSKIYPLSIRCRHHALIASLTVYFSKPGCFVLALIS